MLWAGYLPLNMFSFSLSPAAVIMLEFTDKMDKHMASTIETVKQLVLRHQHAHTYQHELVSAEAKSELFLVMQLGNIWTKNSSSTEVAIKGSELHMSMYSNYWC